MFVQVANDYIEAKRELGEALKKQQKACVIVKPTSEAATSGVSAPVQLTASSTALNNEALAVKDNVSRCFAEAVADCFRTALLKGQESVCTRDGDSACSAFQENLVTSLTEHFGSKFLASTSTPASTPTPSNSVSAQAATPANESNHVAAAEPTLDTTETMERSDTVQEVEFDVQVKVDDFINAPDDYDFEDDVAVAKHKCKEAHKAHESASKYLLLSDNLDCVDWTDVDTCIPLLFIPLVGHISLLWTSNTAYKLGEYEDVQIYVTTDDVSLNSDCPVVGWQIPISEEPTLQLKWHTDEWELPEYIARNRRRREIQARIPYLTLNDNMTIKQLKELTTTAPFILTRPPLPFEKDANKKKKAKVMVVRLDESFVRCVHGSRS